VIHDRRGISLAELIVVLAILGLIGAAIGSTIVRQQRFYRGATDLLAARQDVRDAMELLTTDIRGMAAADTVRLAADSALEFFSSIGVSVVCQTLSATEIGLPAAAPSGNTLSALLTQPDTGDVAVFYQQSADTVTGWEQHRIAAFVARSLAESCDAESGFSPQSDVASGGKGFVVSLATPLTRAVNPGAPVRFIRRGRYSLYRSGDGDWYLGYRRCNALGPSVCGAIQPLSGPYRDHSGDPRKTGILFEYFDALGGRWNPQSSSVGLARVDITARSGDGRAGASADSGTISIALRNRTP